MPYIINVDDIDGLHYELMQAAFDLRIIWDDKQYHFFMEKYIAPLASKLKDFEDNINNYSSILYNLQSMIEDL